MSEDNIAMVMSMGFSADQARTALRNTDNNVERAIEWIFSHPDGEAEPAAAAPSHGDGDSDTHGLTDGPPRYLICFWGSSSPGAEVLYIAFLLCQYSMIPMSHDPNIL